MANKEHKRFKAPDHWTLSQRLDHYTDKSGGLNACWPWTGTRHPWGYGQLGYKSVSRYAHRSAWEKANGPIPPGLHVLHHCDNPPCCNPAHLFLGTRDANMADMAAKKRSPRGERHWNAKLTAEQVVAIKAALKATTKPQTVVAAEFGVSRTTISAIATGRVWGYL